MKNTVVRLLWSILGAVGLVLIVTGVVLAVGVAPALAVWSFPVWALVKTLAFLVVGFFVVNEVRART